MNHEHLGNSCSRVTGDTGTKHCAKDVLGDKQDRDVLTLCGLYVKDGQHIDLLL